MEQNKDYLEREIEKLSLILEALIKKVEHQVPNDIQDDILEEVDIILIDNFGFTLEGFGRLEEQFIIDKLKTINVDINRLALLIYLSIKNLKEENFKPNSSKMDIINNILFALEYSNLSSKTFSFERMGIISDLKQLKISLQ